ncbi:MAG: choline/carnitine O-acyltransferase, partial [Oligoflexales bacterium]|nr:choline/carnitine O-acyltransferase [Oligoflexales bacterium]
REILDIMDTAFLTVSLDIDDHPKDRDECMWLASHKNCFNRWYDKAHQLIVFGNGRAGLNRDHTGVDGHPFVRYLEDLWNIAVKEDTKGENEAAVYDGRDLVKKLVWKLGPKEERSLAKADAFISEELDRRELTCIEIDGAGENFFQKHRASGDTALQLAFQLAGYRQFGRHLSVTESIQMRHFANGRYETLFCNSPESHRFVELMAQKSPNMDLAARYLQKAVEVQKARIKECRQGDHWVFHFVALVNAQQLDSKYKVGWGYIDIGNLMRIHDKPFSKVINVDVTTSNPGRRQGLDISGYSDTSLGVIGIHYYIHPECSRLQIRADRGYLGAAPLMKKGIEESLGKIMKVVEHASRQMH